MLSQTTCSTLLRRSKPLDVPMFPCRSLPSAAVTIRSRSFCRESPLGSDQTSVTFSEGEAAPPPPAGTGAPAYPAATLLPAECGPSRGGTWTTRVSESPCFSGPPSPNPPSGLGPGMITEPARSTRPNPELLFGEGPASVGEYCPVSSSAPLTSSALISAALGVETPFLTSVSRSTAAQP